MNDMQRKSLIAVGAVVLAMLLYPPYRVYGGGDYLAAAGYALIFALPFRATVDVPTLLTQWLGVLILGGIAFLLLKGTD